MSFQAAYVQEKARRGFGEIHGQGKTGNPCRKTRQNEWEKEEDIVANPDPGSGAFLTPGPGSGIRNRFFLDPGSQIHIFDSFVTNFWVKSSKILWKLAQNFFFNIKKKILILWNLWLQKKVSQQIFFHPSLWLLFLDPGSEFRDLGPGIRDG